MGGLLERLGPLPIAGCWARKAQRVRRKRYLAGIKGGEVREPVAEVVRQECGMAFQEALIRWAEAPASGVFFPPISRSAPECRCSVVINTVDRASELKITLAALRAEWRDGDELIVVLGPTGDDSAAVLRNSPVPCRVVTCAEKNLAVSRNLGLHAARGEYVAFIDDDASPAKEWLDALLKPLEMDEGVAISAGFVMDGEGGHFLNQHVVADTLGRAWWFADEAAARRKIAEAGPARTFLTATGCNMAFRRSALDGTGGFDPFYRYFLEETDVVWRILQSGGRCEPCPESVVLHRLGANIARRPTFEIPVRTTIVRSQIHYAGKFAKSGFEPAGIAAAVWGRVLADLEKIAWDCGPVHRPLAACGDLQVRYLRAVADELRLDSRMDSSSLSALSHRE